MSQRLLGAQRLTVTSLLLLQDGHAGDKKGDARRMHTTYARESSHHASAQWKKTPQRSRGEWKRTNSDKIGTRICIDTEDDGWVEGEIIVIKPLRLKRGEKRNRRQYVIKTSETHDTIHGYHVRGEVGEVQLHEMDWWTVAEGGEDNDSGEDNSDGKEEGEERRDAKKPK